VGRRRKEKNLILIFLDFVITLNILSIPLFIIITFGLELSLLKNFEALVTFFILKIMGVNAYVVENVLFVYDKIYEVSWDSTGWKSLYTFFALVVSTPIFFKRKIIPLIIGLLSIFLFNIVRIVTTIYLSSKGILPFDLLHLSLWRWGLIGFLLSIWFIFLYTQKNNIGETKNILGFIYGRRKH